MPDIFYNVIMKKIRILDLVIILLIVSAGIFLIIKTTLHSSLIVSVKADGNEYEYSANAEGIYKVKGRLGFTTFEIKDGKVRIIDSPCPNKTCIRQGWHAPVVCLPNDVIITLKGNEDDYDAVAQ